MTRRVELATHATSFMLLAAVLTWHGWAWVLFAVFVVAALGRRR